jgi:isocitrate dehydrogenase
LRVRYAPTQKVDAGASVFAKGETRGVTDEAISIIEDCGLLFKGPMETPKGGGGKSINVTAPQALERLRQLPHLQDAAGRRDRLLQGRHPHRHGHRPREHRGHLRRRRAPPLQRHDPVQAAHLAPGCDEVHRFAFQTARKLGIKKVHCGHKANIMKMTDGLFLDRFKAAAKDFPEIEAGDVIVDALCMNLVIKPSSTR